MNTEYNIKSALLYIKKILDKHKNEIEANQYHYCLYVIEQFNNWYSYASLSADDLYVLVVGDYNDDFAGDNIANFAESYGVEPCEEMYYMWQTVLIILMVVVNVAYKEEGAKCIPQDLEGIIPAKIGDFFKQIELRMPPKELFEYFCDKMCY